MNLIVNADELVRNVILIPPTGPNIVLFNNTACTFGTIPVTTTLPTSMTGIYTLKVEALIVGKFILLLQDLGSFTSSGWF